MKDVLPGLVRRVSFLADSQPMITLFLGGALAAVFLTAFLPSRPRTSLETPRSLLWILYEQSKRLVWASLLVLVLVGSVVVLRNYLRQTTATFQHTHGRITEANYNAVQTIWGAEQVQGELEVNMFWEEEVTERIESEDITKPAVLRKKIVRHNSTSNPFISARHDVTLTQNPRKKGSAFYGGYETDCRFVWELKNADERGLKGVFRFPLPAASAMYDNLSATLNGFDVMPQVQLKDGALFLWRDIAAGEVLNVAIGFKSRGVSYWYFQVQEAREIRDFTLTLTLPDLPKEMLNYPEGCMTPTHLEPTPGKQGSVLTYRLDHAISSKGMGVALPRLEQPGETTSAVLNKTEEAWLLIFASLLLGLTLAGVPNAALISLMFGAAVCFAYGFLGDFSDLLFGFWGTAGFILVPLLLVLGWLVGMIVKGIFGKLLAVQLVLFGIVYPSIAGLDSPRANLYLNVCGFVFLCFVAWLLTKRFSAQAKTI